LQIFGGVRAIPSRSLTIPAGLDGQVRRTVAGARLEIDHRHEEVEFDLVIRGAGSYVIDGRTYVLKPGMLFWVAPGHQHRLARSPALEMWVVSVRPDLVHPDWIADMAARPSRLLPGEELIDLDWLLSQIAQDSDDAETYNAGIGYALARARRASHDSPPAHVRPMHPAVMRALLLLREEGADFSLSELAAEAGVTAPYLSRLLVEQTGRSFVEWRNRVRLERFLEAYRPGANLLRTALEAGFGSYTRFNQVFNDMVGCSPAEWSEHADRKEPDGAEAFKAASLPRFGMPGASILSGRQRWTGLVSLVGPAIATVLGPRFLERLAKTPPEASDLCRPGFDHLHGSLPASERERLIQSLRGLDRVRTEELAGLLATHDFPGVCSGVFVAYDLSPARLPDAVTALLVTLWVACHPEADPGLPQVKAISRQVSGLLGKRRPNPREAQDALSALLCAFVVTYEAILAARAGGDPRALARLAAEALAAGQTCFDGDLNGFTLTSLGLSLSGDRHGIHRSTVGRGSEG
jgi:AraC-like DNA-binding protein